MPELPEVETYVRQLEPQLNGRLVQSASVHWERTIAAPTLSQFKQEVVGRRFQRFERRGKYMLLGMSDTKTLIVHLRMTGELRLHPLDYPVDKHTHVILTLDDKQVLHYRDIRKFGRLWLVDDPQSVVRHLGPEPLNGELDDEYLPAVLANRKATIKACLLDQRIIAGIGNIYADEGLFRAGIHPQRVAKELTKVELACLRLAIQEVLRRGIALRGSSLQNYTPLDGVAGEFQREHQVFRRTGQPCPHCGESIQRIKVAQRSTHFCPNCQKIKGQGAIYSGRES